MTSMPAQVRYIKPRPIPMMTLATIATQLFISLLRLKLGQMSPRGQPKAKAPMKACCSSKQSVQVRVKVIVMKVNRYTSFSLSFCSGDIRSKVHSIVTVRVKVKTSVKGDVGNLVHLLRFMDPFQKKKHRLIVIVSQLSRKRYQIKELGFRQV